MKHLCPYCKQQMSGDVTLPFLRPRKMRIYRAVLESGPEGIATDDLLARMYAEDEWPTPGGYQVLRVMICEINKVLNGQRIVNAFRGRYRLINLDDQDGKEKAHPETNH